MLGLGIVLVGIVLAVRRRPVAALRAFIPRCPYASSALGPSSLLRRRLNRNVANVEAPLSTSGCFHTVPGGVVRGPRECRKSHQIDTVAAAVEAARTSPYAYAAPSALQRWWWGL